MRNQTIAPENTFVLIVYCMLDPIDNEREKIGDAGLLNAFLKIIPVNNVVHLSDSHSKKITTAVAKDELERMLQNIPGRDEPCQFVFYYGGHGKSKGFCMDDGLFLYADLVELMETYLRPGDSSWCLLDCCYSGNFCTFLQQRVDETGQDLKGSYCCIMSTTYDEEADGDDWCLPGSFVAVMEGRIPPKYNNNPSSEAVASDFPTTINQAVSFMADQHAIIKMDRMTAYTNGPFICPDDSFPFIIRDYDSTDSPRQSSPKRLNPFLRGGWTTSKQTLAVVPHVIPADLHVGDEIYAKWHGGTPENDAIYLLSTWYRATVVSEAKDDSVRVKFACPIPPMIWESEVDKKDTTHELSFNYRYYNDTPSGIELAQRRMAKCRKYVDYSIPVGTRVHGLWADQDVLYEAEIISDRDIPWNKLARNHFQKKFSNMKGPYVLVEWTEDECWTIVPRSHVFVHGGSSDTIPAATEMRHQAKLAIQQEKMLVQTPMECLLRSFQSAGKSLIPAEKVADSSQLTCFCAEDSEWFDAEYDVLDDLDDDDLEVLASHVCYKETGDYCIVRWDEDGSKSCLPKKFVRKR